MTIEERRELAKDYQTFLLEILDQGEEGTTPPVDDHREVVYHIKEIVYNTRHCFPYLSALVGMIGSVFIAGVEQEASASMVQFLHHYEEWQKTYGKVIPDLEEVNISLSTDQDKVTP